MKELMEPSFFFDSPLAEDATWYSMVTEQNEPIRVIWRNNPFEGDFESSTPEIEVHSSFAKLIQQRDLVRIERREHEVESVSPPDSEGFMTIKLSDASPYSEEIHDAGS